MAKSKTVIFFKFNEPTYVIFFCYITMLLISCWLLIHIFDICSNVKQFKKWFIKGWNDSAKSYYLIGCNTSWAFILLKLNDRENVSIKHLSINTVKENLSQAKYNGFQGYFVFYNVVSTCPTHVAKELPVPLMQWNFAFFAKIFFSYLTASSGLDKFCLYLVRLYEHLEIKKMLEMLIIQ